MAQPKRRDSKVLHLRMDQDTFNRLSQYAKQEQRSLTNTIGYILYKFFSEREGGDACTHNSHNNHNQ